MNDASDELFIVWGVWSSRDSLLYPAMEEHAKLHGFNIVKVQTYIYCNRRGKGGDTKRNYVEGGLSSDCPFGVTLRALS